MNTKKGHFFTNILKYNSRSYLALASYISCVYTFIGFDLPSVLNIICSTLSILFILIGSTIYISDFKDIIEEKIIDKPVKMIIEKTKKIVKELLMFIPILLISQFVVPLIFVGQPSNQTIIEESFFEKPISISICAIIIIPIIEEFIFRFLPYQFIKNKILYIIISAVVFASMHVVDDLNPIYYIWFYMIRALYYGYRYHKTNDLLISISLHSFNNTIAIFNLLYSIY